jgi:voltage-gated sodium channel
VAGSMSDSHDFLPVLRTFRVMHLMAMMDASPKMRQILSGFWKAIPGVANVLCLLLLFFYIFCVLGVFMFRDLGASEFQHIGASMKPMFQVLTGDDWANVMRSTEKVAKYASAYFISFYVVMVFIILNLFIGVVVGAMQSAEEEIFNKSDDDTDAKQLLLLENLKKQLDRLEKKLESKNSK